MENVQLSDLSPGAGDRVCELLTTVLGVLGEAGAVRGWAGSAAAVRERVRLAQQVVAVAESVRLAVVRQVQARPEVVPGAGGGAAGGGPAVRLLAGRGRVDPGQARRDVAAAEAADPDGGSLPLLGAALAAGEISRAHLDIAVGAVGRLPSRIKTMVLDDGRTGLEWIDAFLVRYCREHPPGTIRQLVREMLHLLDEDRPDPLPEAVKRRSLRYRNDAGTGMLVGSFALDPAAGAEVVAALEAFAAPSPAGSARTRDGQDRQIGDVRSRPQRLADALATIAEIALGASSPHPRRDHPTGDPTGAGAGSGCGCGCGCGCGPAPGSDGSEDAPREGAEPVTGRRARADLSVVATWEQLVAAGLAPHLPAQVQRAARAAGLARMGLAGGADRPGAALSPATLARLACDATWRRVLVGPTGAPLDLGRSQRRASAGQRAALLVRDGGCVIPGCGMPLSWSDVHHDHRWADGGSTDIGNLFGACGRHHTEIHAGIWQVEWHDGLPWIRPPAWLDPARPLLRNTTHAARHAARTLAQHLRLHLDEQQPGAGRGGWLPQPVDDWPDPGQRRARGPGGDCPARVRRPRDAHTAPRPPWRPPRPTPDLCRARPRHTGRPAVGWELHHRPHEPCGPPG